MDTKYSTTDNEHKSQPERLGTNDDSDMKKTKKNQQKKNFLFQPI
jgi:hypothetical protein